MLFPYERDINDIIYHGSQLTGRQVAEWP